MKKFISFVMAAAMVASLVPATAFAASDEIKGSVRVVNAWDKKTSNTSFTGLVDGSQVPEIQIRITDVDYLRTTGSKPKAKVTVSLDNAKFEGFDTTADDTNTDVKIKNSDGDEIVADDDSGAADATYDFSAAIATTDAIKAALKDIVENGATNYVTVSKGDAGKSAQSTAGTVITADDVITAAAVGTAEARILTAVNTNKASFNIPSTTTVASAYEYNTTSKSLLKKVTTAVGPDVITRAELEAVIGPLSDYEDVTLTDANYTTAAGKVTASGALVDTDSLDFVKQTTHAASVGMGTDAKKRVALIAMDPADPNGKDEVEFTFEGWFKAGDIISINLPSQMKNAAKDALVSVTSNDMTLSNDGADIVYVNAADQNIKLSVKKTVDVAEEEATALHSNGLKIESGVETFVAGDVITLKLSKGFAFVEDCMNNGNGGSDWSVVAKDADGNAATAPTIRHIDDNEWEVTVNAATKSITICGIDVEATSAKSGTVGTIRATAKGYESAAVEVIKVVDYKVVLSVDEDEDIPVIYSAVNVDNDGITDDSDHWSLEVTAEETFPGAWSFRKGFNFELPEGVYVTDIEVKGVDGFLKSKTNAVASATAVKKGEVVKAFFDAYKNGGHVNFEFDKRVFDDVDAKLNDDVATMSFKLQLVADPGFVGDVVLKLTGDLVDTQEVTIAKFVMPYEVKAEQNDLKIDYRYTDIPTEITITEAEAGLWDEDARFDFYIEKDLIAFEGDPTFEIDSKSDLQIKKEGAKNGRITFMVKDESDEAATVTMKDMQLFMQRNIPAGPYKLKIASSLAEAYEAQMLFAPDYKKCDQDGNITAGTHKYAGSDHDEDCWVGDVCDYGTTVKEAFINVITAGREVDDASFTTKVVVPVGENYIIAGEKQIELDTPAYINEAGYTMLPIRAVAVALGINTNNVLWDQPTKTVTILYGQRIITMTQGQKVVYVNGSAIPASAAVENTNSRTFLPMRDLATALGVTDITWDQATRTATLNGNQK